MNKKVRPAAVAGSFYPAQPQPLRQMIEEFLADAGGNGPAPKALIVPHAGYIYSGPIAAAAYRLLQAAGTAVNRVILLGPAHTMPVQGLVGSNADAFATPLGSVPLDQEALEEVLALPQVTVLDEGHRREHGLEVQLPFLQTVCGEFRLVPLVVGEATMAEVTAVLEKLWGGPETLIIISSDLSHYHDYETAQRRDAATAAAIEALRPEAIEPDQACGYLPIQGLLRAARRRQLQVRRLDLRNSGDTAGPRHRVVGYGAFAFYPR